MSWNYRLVKHESDEGEYYGVHEVYYDAEGKESQWSAEGVRFGGDTPEEAIESLRMAIRDCENSPVFVPPAE